MPESHNIEYKASWRDEYLKWICGFANANGGKLYIGIDDKGKVTGIDNHNKLLVDLPNKFRDILGVYAEVNLQEGKGKHYLEISVPRYDVPISVRGKYYIRTGRDFRRRFKESTPIETEKSIACRCLFQSRLHRLMGTGNHQDY